jgi:hypothetical protein
MQAFKWSIEDFVERYKDQKIDIVAGTPLTWALDFKWEKRYILSIFYVCVAAGFSLLD